MIAGVLKHCHKRLWTICIMVSLVGIVFGIFYNCIHVLSNVCRGLCFILCIYVRHMLLQTIV